MVRVEVRRRLGAMRRQLAGMERLEKEALERRLDELLDGVATELVGRLDEPMRRVLNATGILVHTNLGRSPLAGEVAASLEPLLTAYCDLELDLAAGRRASRNRRLEALLTAVTGAEAAVVANNNAAALVLALAALAGGREVVVSRGELVEIGDSFRIPDMVEAAGARMTEVGTTNRTRIADYAEAVTPRTAVLLKVHPSNYRIRGFTGQVSVDELVELGRERGLAVLVDEGSGLLRRHPLPQLADHPSLEELAAAGCDLACGSGDKLLGGPQAGLLIGKRGAIEQCRRHPLYRAVRPDRFTCAALEAVLRRLLAGGPSLVDRLRQDPEVLHRRLEAAAARLGAEIAPADAYLGGGSAPDAPIPGEALVLPADDELLRRLRTGTPAVLGYLRDGRLVLDLRTVDPVDDDALVVAVEKALER